MRNAILLIAFLFGSADALAQDPLDTAPRDAQRLAECMKALDAPCVISLSDVRSYRLLGTTGFDFAKAQTRYFDSLRVHSRGWITFNVTAPPQVLQVGTRLNAFVPYVSRSNFGGQIHTKQTFEVAVSADRGETWMFVDGLHLTPARMRVIIPSDSGQPLPPTRELEPTAGH